MKNLTFCCVHYQILDRFQAFPIAEIFRKQENGKGCLSACFGIYENDLKMKGRQL